MESILYILAWILCGMAAGIFGKKSAFLLRLADRGALLAVYSLLFLLGAGLGADAALLARLPELGAAALCITLCCSAGSVLCLTLASPWILRGALPSAGRVEGAADSFRPGESVPGEAVPGAIPSPLWGTLRITACFAAGILLSRLGVVPSFMLQSSLASYALYLLVLMVGVGLGADARAFGIVRVMHVRILAVPLLIILGTFAGALSAAVLLPHSTVRDCLSVGSGLGYYSLSSLLIEGSGNAALASTALLSNIFREMLGIFSAPLLARRYGGLAPVAAAGATAMDTCLPVIARFSGERYAVIAVFSGMVLTLAVPFLVTGVLNW